MTDVGTKGLDFGVGRKRLVALVEAQRSQVLAALHFQAAELCDLLPFDDFLSLVEHFGGSDCYMPTRLRPDYLLVKLVGLPAAKRLTQLAGGGERFKVPPVSEIARAVRPLVVGELLSRGMSHRTIARRLGIHIRTVERAAEKASHKPRSTRKALAARGIALKGPAPLERVFNERSRGHP